MLKQESLSVDSGYFNCLEIKGKNILSCGCCQHVGTFISFKFNFDATLTFTTTLVLQTMWNMIFLLISLDIETMSNKKFLAQAVLEVKVPEQSDTTENITYQHMCADSKN